MVRALSHVLFFFNPGPVRRVPSPNRYTAEAKLCFCKNNKRMIIKAAFKQTLISKCSNKGEESLCPSIQRKAHESAYWPTIGMQGPGGRHLGCAA
jgi:hypothetical protein